MKSTVAAVVLAAAVSGSASAQTAEFKCPVGGTQFTYKGDNFGGVNTATGQHGNACLFNRMSDGKSEALRVHWGLVGSVDAQSDSSANGIDLKSLWPLKIGNTTAGIFDAFRLEETKEGSSVRTLHWWAPALATSAKESFPDWRDLGKVIVLELASVKAAAN